MVVTTLSKKRSILKHFAKFPDCNNVYQSPALESELEKIKRFSKARSDILREKRLKKMSEDYIKNKLSNDPNINEKVKKDQIKCKACKRKFQNNKILWHISKSLQCNDFYSHSSLKKERAMIKIKCQKA